MLSNIIVDENSQSAVIVETTRSKKLVLYKKIILYLFTINKIFF